MRKLIESTFVTLDGVISEPHAWGQPYWDAEHDAYLLAGDVAEAVQRLKEIEVADGLKYGTGELDQTLLDHGLLDNVLSSPAAHLKVADRSNFSSGITVLTLVPRNQV